MSEIEVRKIQLTEALNIRRSLRKAVLTPFVCSVIASFGIFGGISALFVGIMLVVLHSIVADDQMFDGIGTGLLIIAIPLILIGSVFVDEIVAKR